MDVTSEMISIATPAGSMPALRACPAGAQRLPGVIVVQEAFGLNDHIKGVARRLAAEGYVTLAPDLFYRGGAGRTASYAELPKALEMMNALKDPEIIEDVAAAVARLESDPAVRADRIGITGFCMGGRVAYLAACALPDKIKAAVPFYGGGIPVERTDGLACPVLALFGEDDPYIPMTQVAHLRAEAARLGKRVDVVVYPKAPHGFFCDERDSYRPAAAADAWKRTLAFFAQHLA
ncbi:MAG TPA: dienelactone hydrolase family protein [Candidatus Limnocylindria bacterium]|nr:dienelactone hydrolase family protein [Candidatus Limnocylindria bacterium]